MSKWWKLVEFISAIIQNKKHSQFTADQTFKAFTPAEQWNFNHNSWLLHLTKHFFFRSNSTEDVFDETRRLRIIIIQCRRHISHMQRPLVKLHCKRTTPVWENKSKQNRKNILLNRLLLLIVSSFSSSWFLLNSFLPFLAVINFRFFISSFVISQMKKKFELYHVCSLYLSVCVYESRSEANFGSAKRERDRERG